MTMRRRTSFATTFALVVIGCSACGESEITNPIVESELPGSIALTTHSLGVAGDHVRIGRLYGIQKASISQNLLPVG